MHSEFLVLCWLPYDSGLYNLELGSKNVRRRSGYQYVLKPFCIWVRSWRTAETASLLCPWVGLRDPAQMSPLRDGSELWKHKDVSSDPQYPRKSWVWLHMQTCPGKQTVDPRDLLDSQNSELWFSKTGWKVTEEDTVTHLCLLQTLGGKMIATV